MDEQKAVVSSLLNKIIGATSFIFGSIGSLVMIIAKIQGKETSFVTLIPTIWLIGGLILMEIARIQDNQKILDNKLDSLSKE